MSAASGIRARDIPEIVLLLGLLSVLLSAHRFTGAGTLVALAVITMMLMPDELDAIYDRSRIAAMTVIIVATSGGCILNIVLDHAWQSTPPTTLWALLDHLGVNRSWDNQVVVGCCSAASLVTGYALYASGVRLARHLLGMPVGTD